MFENVYNDKLRADSYSKLEFPGTYYLAYRDIPEIIAKHIIGTNAIDFGCGAGRSTRFLKKLGFNTVGIDISADMIKKALEFDIAGQYYKIESAHFSDIRRNNDLILSMFTFDNIGSYEDKFNNLIGLKRLLREGGKLISLVSSPDIYFHEWASFSTKDFPENKTAKCGDIVKIIMTDVDDKRPVLDVIWPHENYMELFTKTKFKVVEVYKPLGRISDPFEWVNEMEISPWTIYVLE